jgi:hypothetical protein
LEVSTTKEEGMEEKKEVWNPKKACIEKVKQKGIRREEREVI